MSETDVKMALEKIHTKNYGVEILKKVKDNYIQGIQLNVCYMSHWQDIRKIFKLNDLNLNKYGPILTMNECNSVKIINELPHRDGIEFITMLHAFPIWCRKKYLKEFQNWFEKNRSILLSFRGTHLEIDKQIKDLIE